MATDSWINETLYPEWGQRFLVKRELARVKSDFQDIVIFESFSHGRDWGFGRPARGTGFSQPGRRFFVRALC